MAEDEPPTRRGVYKRRRREWHQTENRAIIATDWYLTARRKEIGESKDAENEYSRTRCCDRRGAKKYVILEHHVEFRRSRGMCISVATRLTRDRRVRRTRSRLVEIWRGSMLERRKFPRYTRRIDESALA